MDAALAAGRITKEQADALKTAIDAGGLPLGGPGLGLGVGRPHGLFGGFDHGPFGGFDAAASYLGLSEAELRSRLASGNSLADVAKAQGKSVDGLKQAMTSAFQSKLDQAVNDGRLTTAERDRILADFESRLDDLINGTLPPRPSLGFHERFGFRFAPGGFQRPIPAGAPWHGGNHVSPMTPLLLRSASRAA